MEVVGAAEEVSEWLDGWMEVVSAVVVVGEWLLCK